MAWRLHLSNRSIQQLDILRGEQTLLAAWWRRDRVAYYDIETGLMTGESVIYVPDVEDRNLLVWQEFVRTLKAPNGVNLPVVQTPHETVYLADNDQIRLYRAGAAELFLQLQHGNDEIKLDVKATHQFRLVRFSRQNEITAALDVKGKVHLYRQTKRLGAYDVGIKLQSDDPASLALSDDGNAVFVADSQQIIRLDATGKIQKRLLTHYPIGRLTCTPNGKQVLTSDLETDVLRIYDAETLTMTHQRFAIDLLADAAQIQLLADLPSIFVGLNAMTLDDSGNIAFAMSGMLCATAIEHMIKVPVANPPYPRPPSLNPSPIVPPALPAPAPISHKE